MAGSAGILPRGASASPDGRGACAPAGSRLRYHTRTSAASGRRDLLGGGPRVPPELRLVVLAGVGLFALILVASMVRSVPQATVAVVTIFGKYRRLMRAGLNF